MSHNQHSIGKSLRPLKSNCPWMDRMHDATSDNQVRLSMSSLTKWSQWSPIESGKSKNASPALTKHDAQESSYEPSPVPYIWALSRLATVAQWACSCLAGLVLSLPDIYAIGGCRAKRGSGAVKWGGCEVAYLCTCRKRGSDRVESTTDTERTESKHLATASLHHQRSSVDVHPVIPFNKP